ncbi:hypothetical protein K7X08_000236 [Anisodus acutangulus]|uniref:Uncharacterized protein n=1 Tax=Anisodus acutangulus TaxID=402998 RepID=A0A9Q1M3F7_9SOLA|nr:hypothetical protein K7X08_000236 [Anisodus acutangulus]
MSTFTLSSDVEEVEEKYKEYEVTSQSLVVESTNNVGSGDIDALVETSETTRDSRELVLETQMEKDEEKAAGQGAGLLKLHDDIQTCGCTGNVGNAKKNGVIVDFTHHTRKHRQM